MEMHGVTATESEPAGSGKDRGDTGRKSGVGGGQRASSLQCTRAHARVEGRRKNEPGSASRTGPRPGCIGQRFAVYGRASVRP